MVEGIWLGKVIRSEENIVAVKGEAGATSGIYKVGDIMRQEATVRWSKEAIDTIKGTPKDPCPDLVRTNAPRHTIPTYTNPNARQYRKPSEVVAQEDEERDIRRMQTTRADVEDNGPTDGCRGCRAIRRGDAKHQGHSEACRQRMEDLIKAKAGGQERIDRALERMTQAIVDQSEALLRKIE